MYKKVGIIPSNNSLSEGPQMKALVLTLLMAFGLVMPSYAFDFLGDARNAWQGYQNGQVKPNVAGKQGANDTWGSPESAMPVQKAKPVSKSIVPEAANTWGEGETRQVVRVPSPEPVPAWRAPKPAPAPVIKKEPTTASTKASKRVVERDYVEVEEPVVQLPRGAVPSFARASVEAYSYQGCANPTRTLEGAKMLAMKGLEAKAYEAYLSLMSTCEPNALIQVYMEARATLSAEKLQMLMDEPVMASPKLMPVVSFATLQSLYDLNENGEFDKATQLVRDNSNLILRVSEAGAPLVAGWLEQRNKQYAVAEQYFKRALTIGKEPQIANSALEGLVLASLAQGNVDRAVQLASNKKYKVGLPIQGEIALAQARVLLAEGQGAQALEYVDKALKAGVKLDNSVLATQAWALRAAGRKPEAKAIFERLYNKEPSNLEYQQGFVESLSDSREISTLKTIQGALKGDAQARAQEVIAQSYSQRGQRGMAAEVSGVSDEALSSYATAVAGTRNKSGDVGEEKLTHDYAGVNAKAQLSNQVAIESAVGSHQFNNGKTSLSVRDASIGLTMEDEDNTYRMTVGQMQSTNKSPGVAYGEASIKTYGDELTQQLAVGRKPVLDSVKSVQEGVAKTYVATNGKYDMGDNTNITYAGELGVAKGKKTVSTGYYEASAGYNWDLQRKGWSWLSLGPEVAIKGYADDNNQFDAIHGGYYSPLSQYDFGLKANALSQEGGTRLLKGTVRAGLSSKTLKDSSVSGMYLEGDVAAGWLVNPYLALGGGLSVKSSSGYSDTTAWLWATVPFEKRRGLFAEDLRWGFTK